MVLDLANVEFDDRDLFLFGGINIPKAQLKIPNQSQEWNRAIEFTKHILYNQSTDILTDGDVYPIGLLLLYSSDSIPIVLNEHWPSVFALSWLKDLKVWTKDMIIYGKKTHSNRCKIFEDIYPDFVNFKYTKRNYNEC